MLVYGIPNDRAFDVRVWRTPQTKYPARRLTPARVCAPSSITCCSPSIKEPTPGVGGGRGRCSHPVNPGPEHPSTPSSGTVSGQPPTAVGGCVTGERAEARTDNQAGNQERHWIHRFHVQGARLDVPRGEAHRVRQPPGKQTGTHQARAEPECRSDQYQCSHKINFAITGCAVIERPRRRSSRPFRPSPARNPRPRHWDGILQSKSVLTWPFGRDAGNVFQQSLHSLHSPGTAPTRTICSNHPFAWSARTCPQQAESGVISSPSYA
ncbi:hypothetical protein M2275_002006 [Rhodococcus opacus]|nr:hypothetical protein [Rhodococcus opacus]